MWSNNCVANDSVDLGLQPKRQKIINNENCSILIWSFQIALAI